MSFKVGDKVKGLYARFNEVIDDYVQFPYSGTISHNFEDGSFIVTTPDNKDLLIEAEYFELETMELADETT